VKIALVGGGVMGEAIVAGLLRHGVIEPAGIAVADVDPARLAALSSAHGVTTADTRTAIAGADVVILAVKPQVIHDVLDDVAPCLSSAQLVISIAAGIPIARLASGLQHYGIVRVMPNTPAQIGQGVSVWTATAEVEPEQRVLAERILESLGPEVYVEKEDLLDMATALSGSGPAYVFLFIEALIDAGVHIGLSRPLATQLVTQTVSGSVAFMEQSQSHAAELKNMVTSPGGTTSAALATLEKGAFRGLLIDAVESALRRARQLGAES
jgi:pyrroline-5-carboxylate reductase